MTDLITAIQDSMNPHALIQLSSPADQKIDVETIKHILKRAGVVTWGWEITDTHITLRVYAPHRHTAKGVLEDAGVKFL
jgi:hypothetical protein